MNKINFNKKELEILNKVVELYDLEPENNHVHSYIVRPTLNLIREIELEGEYDSVLWYNEQLNFVMKRLYEEIKTNTDRCRKKTYNRRIRNLRDLLKNKLGA